MSQIFGLKGNMKDINFSPAICLNYNETKHFTTALPPTADVNPRKSLAGPINHSDE